MGEMAEGDEPDCSEKLRDVPFELPPPAFDSSLRPRQQHRVGFDCEFVERPKELQIECPICLHILREPYQATCCGYIYCQSCIERVKSGSKPCPTCNNTDFDIFPDKRLHKTLYGFKVWCSNKKLGCNWSGELRDLVVHSNTDPVYTRRLLGCEFVEIECSLCHEFIQRGKLKTHEAKSCLFREYTCEFCDKYTSNYTDVVKKHQPQCPFQLVACPNNCGQSVQRQKLGQHVKEECEQRLPDKIACEYSFAGCSEMIPPDHMQEHLKEDVHIHLSLLASSHQGLRERLIQLQGHLDDNNRYIERLQTEKKEMQEQFQREMLEMRSLRFEFDKLRLKQDEDRRSIELLQNYSSILPIIYTLDEYEARRRRGDMGWSSAPFYTHLQGYRMCLWVDIGGNGPGKGIYISVFLSLMKGEFDAKLKWPFRGSVVVQLLNQRDEDSHHTEVIKYHDNTPNATAGRVMEEGRMSKPWGKGKFIKHEELKDGGYVKNDCLKFRVNRINLDT